jgi:proteic killer suppression protein
VIRSFADRPTHELYTTGRSRRLPPEIWKRAVLKLEQLNAATGLGDLEVPPSNRLHALRHERAGQYSVSVNDQWRICFRFVDGEAFGVEICDYH